MEHTLFVTKDYLRGFDFHQSLQTVVTNDDTAIEIVQVGCGETATVQRNEWTQFWWCHRNDFHNHPFGTVNLAAGTECLYYLQALQCLRLALLS